MIYVFFKKITVNTLQKYNIFDIKRLVSKNSL